MMITIEAAAFFVLIAFIDGLLYGGYSTFVYENEVLGGGKREVKQ